MASRRPAMICVRGISIRERGKARLEKDIQKHEKELLQKLRQRIEFQKRELAEASLDLQRMHQQLARLEKHHESKT
jgi:hypothetical protein